MVSDGTRRIATRFRGFLQSRVRALRGVASLLGRARKCCGGLPQGRARSRRADDRCRTPVPARVLPSGHRRSRGAARVLPFQRHALPADRSGARRARRMGARSPSAAGATCLAARLGRSSGARPRLSSGLQRPAEPASGPRDHGATLRRGPGDANPPGDGARDRRLEASPRDGCVPQRLPPERGTRRLRRPRARTRVSGAMGRRTGRSPGGHASGQRVHHAHAGRRGVRSIRARPRRCSAWRLRTGRAGTLSRRAPGAWSGAPYRPPRTIQHCLAGSTVQRRDQCRQPATRRREPAHLPAALSAISGVRGAHRVRDQRRPCAELGLAGSRRALDHGVRARSMARNHAVGRRTDCGAVGRGALGASGSFTRPPGIVRARAAERAARRVRDWREASWTRRPGYSIPMR